MSNHIGLALATNGYISRRSSPQVVDDVEVEVKLSDALVVEVEEEGAIEVTVDL